MTTRLATIEEGQARRMPLVLDDGTALDAPAAARAAGLDPAPLADMVATLCQGLTLETEDVVATGTSSGMGYPTTPRVLGPGDVIEATVEGIGTLRTTIVA